MEIYKYDLSDKLPMDRRWQVEDCVITCSLCVFQNVIVSLPSKQGVCRGYRINIEDPTFTGKILLTLGPGTGRIDIKTRGPAHIDVRVWRGGTLVIGEGTTVNNARIVCDDADVLVGEDGLWSDEILIQSNDQHGIVDSVTGEILNAGRRRIEIGAHVWLGRRTTVMPNVTIGAGSILAAGAVLTKNVPRNCIFAGIPARSIKTGVTWSRSPNGMNDHEKKYLE